MIYRLTNMAFHSFAQCGAHLHMNLPAKLFSQHMLHVFTNCHCFICSDISAMIRWYASIPSNTTQSSIKLFTHLSTASPLEHENSPSHMRVNRGASQLILQNSVIALSQWASFNAWSKHENDAYTKRLCRDVLAERAKLNSVNGLPSHIKSSQVMRRLPGDALATQLPPLPDHPQPITMSKFSLGVR